MDKIVMIPALFMMVTVAGVLFFFYGVDYFFNRSDYKELEELEKKLY